jgi:tetratricopeptide (TPR) repeat protein
MTLATSAFSLALLMYFPALLHSQAASFDRLQVAPAPIQNTNSIDPNAPAEELEMRADQLRAQKEFADALDFYRAALAKKPENALLYNKRGICELLEQRYRNARSDFERALRIDPRYAPAYNNLGVMEYATRKYSKAIKQYEKAIRLEPSGAAYYSNLGAAYFAKKSWEKATKAYSEAVNLDPDIFDQSNRSGITGQVASPSDRAHFSFVLAKLYARSGMNDRSLEYLRRAMEEGYKGVNEVYSDVDFTALRKDPRFAQLMSARPVTIPE